jgi:predicted ATPase
MVRQVLGEKAEGVALSQAAVEQARLGGGGPFALSFVLHVDSFARIFAGDLRGLRKNADELLELAERNNFGDFRSEALLFRGWAAAWEGEPEAGLAAVAEGVAALRAVGLRLQGTLYAGLLADCQRMAGLFEDATHTVESAIAEMEATGERFYEAELHRLRSQILRDRVFAETENAKASLVTAAEIAESQGASLFRLRAEAMITSPAILAREA